MSILNWVKPTFSDYSDQSSQPRKKPKLDNETKRKRKNDTTETLSSAEKAWINTWKPKRKEDLVIHKKKIEEVENWLKFIKKGQNSSILLLTGPPGSGKLTTLKVLCSTLGVNLVEWIPQIAMRDFDPEKGGSYQSETSLFEDFVLRATRYSNVLNLVSSRLIVVKDIPNGYIKDSSRFHDFLDNFTADNVYLSFITTDVNITRDLFNENIKNKHSITTISFNPVTQRSIKTALEKSSGGKFKEYISGISLSCDGDLRNALATLQFLSVKDRLPQKKKKINDENDNIKKTDVIDLFRGLGRVLYAKRENKILTHCPIEVAESFTSSPDLFLGMLQQNYLNTFSSIHDVAKASQKLSTSNIIVSDYKDMMASRLLGLIIATHGLMSSNSDPIKKFQQFDKQRKITNSTIDFKTNNMYTNDAIIDFVTFGRRIPSFNSANKELLSKCSPLL